MNGKPSGHPYIGDVARDACRCKKDYVNSHMIAVANILMCNRFRGHCNPAQTEFVDRMIQFFAAFAPFHLGKCDNAEMPLRRAIWSISPNGVFTRSAKICQPCRRRNIAARNSPCRPARSARLLVAVSRFIRPSIPSRGHKASCDRSRLPWLLARRPEKLSSW